MRQVADVTGIAMKYLVIKIDDYHEALEEREKDQLADLLHRIQFYRVTQLKSPTNQYVVINTDEPYADEVIAIMKKHGHWG
jgi:hypothetical protein